MRTTRRTAGHKSVRHLIREACRRVSPVRLGRAGPALTLEKLENRQLLSAVMTNTFLANQQSGLPASNTDLLNGLPASSSTYTAETATSGPISILNDGKVSADPANANEAADASNSVFNPSAQWMVTYTLPVNANGWSITSIDSFAGAPNNRTNQYFEILVKTKDSFWPTPLSASGAGFTYTPGAAGASEVHITDTRGVLATGVTEITFQALGADIATAPGQAPIFRELDVFGTPTTVPAAPTGVTGKAGPNAARISWNAVAGAEYYEIWRSEGDPNSGYWMIQNDHPDTFFVDTMAYNGSTYYYKVLAKNAAGSSALSSPPVMVRPADVRADAPTNIKAVGDWGKVNLSWTAEPFATGYFVYRSDKAAGPFVKVTADPLFTTTYTDSGLNNGTTYYYKLTSNNVLGEGAQSNPAVSAITALIGNGNGAVGMYWDDGGEPLAGSNPQAIDPARLFIGPLFVRADNSINFDWTTNSPMPQMGVDTFSTRWIADLLAPTTDRYTFHTNTDDGSFVYLDGVKIIDDPYYHGIGTERTSEALAPGGMPLEAGKKYRLVVEQFENAGSAGAILSWSTATLAKTAVPKSQLFQPTLGAGSTPTLTAGDSQVALSWQPVPGALHYTIRRGPAADNLKDVAAGITGTSYVDTPLTNGTTYFYAVVPVNDTGAGTDSAAVSVVPMPSKPAAPATLTVRPAGGGMLKLSWDAVPLAVTYTVKRAEAAGGPYATVAADVATNSFRDNNLEASKTYYYVVSASNVAGEGPDSPEGSATVGTLLNGWYEDDIGTTLPGSSTYDSATGTFTVTGNGADIWDGGDRFHYVYIPVHGEATITARVTSMVNNDGTPVNGWLKAGVMAREAIDTNSVHAFTAATPANGMSQQGRTATGPNNNSNVQTGVAYPYGNPAPAPIPGAYTMLQAPIWVRLTREGNTFLAYYSDDGDDWQLFNRRYIASFAPDYYVGLAVTSHEAAKLATATFESVSVASSTQLAAPTNLQFQMRSNVFAMNWNATQLVTGYEVQRSASADFSSPDTYTLAATANSFSNTAPSASGTWYYRIRALSAVSGQADSAWTVFSGTPSTGKITGGEGISARFWNTRQIVNGAPNRYVSGIALARNEPNGISYDWGSNAPASGVNTDNYTSLFSGKVTAPMTGVYQFISRSDDGGFVWVDGTLVSADANGHGLREPNPGDTARNPRNVLATVTLEEGKAYDIVVSQYDGTGGSGIQLDWVRPDNVRARIPGNAFTGALGAPAAPTDLALVSDGSAGGVVQFTFNDASWSESAFVVERAYDAAFTNPVRYNLRGNWGFSAWRSNTTMAFGDAPVLPDMQYYYRVKAINYDAESDWSQPLAVKTPADVRASGQGLVGHYYSETSSANVSEPNFVPGGSVYAKLEGPVDFTGPTAGTWTPFPGQNNEYFSVRWTGKVLVDDAYDNQMFTFVTRSDDSNYLWVDGKLVASDPGGHGERDNIDINTTTNLPYGTTLPIALSKGWHNITYVSAQGTGGFGSHLKWIVPDGTNTRTIIPADHLRPDQDIPAKASITSLYDLTDRAVSFFIKDDPAAYTDTDYLVQRAENPTFTAGLVDVARFGVLNDQTLRVTDTGLTAGKAYYYRVAAMNYDGAAFSDTFTVTTDATPSAPMPASNLVGDALNARKVRLQWQDNAINEESFVIERRTGENGAFAVVGTAGAGATQFIDADAALVAGTTYFYQVRSANAAGQSDPTAAISVVVAEDTLAGTPWQTRDIGLSVGTDPLPGDAVHITRDGLDQYEVTGGGSDVWNLADPFRYMYQPLEGDGTMIARVLTQENTASWAKAGAMIRADLVPTAPHLILAMTPQNFVAFQGRIGYGSLSYEWDTDPSAVNNARANATYPVWIKLSRKNNTFSGFISQDGQNWTQVSQDIVNDDFGPTAYIGLAVTATNVQRVSTSVFDNVSVTKAATMVKQATPTAVTAAAGQGEGLIRVSWQDNASAETGYQILRGSSAGGSFTPIATVPANYTGYTDPTGSTSASYYYKIVALNDRGPGLNSDPSDAAQGSAGAYPAPIKMNDFSNATGWQLNGSAITSNTAQPVPPPWTAQIVTNTDGKQVLRLSEARTTAQYQSNTWHVGSAFTNDKYDISAFTASFDYQVTSSAGADGMTFIIQNDSRGPTAYGGAGGMLGYGAGNNFAAIGNSIAIKLDFYPSASNTNSTGLYHRGMNPDDNVINSRDMNPAGIDLESGHVLRVTLMYRNDVLTEMVKDTQTGAIYRADYKVNIPYVVGGSTAYIGFAGSAGGAAANQDILSFSFSNAYTEPPVNLVVNGTAGDDTIYVKREGGNLKAWVNVPTTGAATITRAWDENLQSLTVNGLEGNDAIIMDYSGGALRPWGGVTVDGGAGDNRLNVRGFAAGDDLAVSATQVQWAGNTLPYGNATVEIGKRSAEIGTTASVVELKSLSVSGTAKVALATAGLDGAGQTRDQVFVLSGLDIASGAQLDVADNSIILKHTAGDYGVSLAGSLMDKVNSGRTAGANAWEGPGIISSNAKANELSLTTVGVLNNNSEGAAFIQNYYGVAVDADVIILKYTYFGDTNLDGEITGSDYAVTDLAYWLATPNPGWKNGDNNGDGVVDGSDYAVMDLAFWLQEAGKPLGGELFDEPIVGDAPTPAFDAAPITAAGAAVARRPEGSFLTDDIAVLA